MVDFHKINNHYTSDSRKLFNAGFFFLPILWKKFHKMLQHLLGPDQARRRWSWQLHVKPSLPCLSTGCYLLDSMIPLPNKCFCHLPSRSWQCIPHGVTLKNGSEAPTCPGCGRSMGVQTHYVGDCQFTSGPNSNCRHWPIRSYRDWDLAISRNAFSHMASPAIIISSECPHLK